VIRRVMSILWRGLEGSEGAGFHCTAVKAWSGLSDEETELESKKDSGRKKD
jgi:hypothetical protein